MQNIKENWKNVLSIMQSEVTTITFDLWVKTLEPVAIKDNCLIILASSETAKKRCSELVQTSSNLQLLMLMQM